MKPTVSLSKSGPGLGAITSGIARLTSSQVLVGIPADKNLRKTVNGKAAPINNAELLYILTNGSPVRGIPATPIIEPAIMADDNRKRIVGILRQAAEAELAGQHQDALELLAKAGTAGANAAKRWFTDPRNGWPQNALSTANRKLGRMKPKEREAAIDRIVAAGGDMTGEVTRNIDTGDLRRKITYVVIDGGSSDQRQDENEEEKLEQGEGEAGEAAEIAEVALL